MTSAIPSTNAKLRHATQLVVQSVHEGEGELGELRDGPADVAEQDELGTMWMTSPHHDVQWDTTGLERAANRTTRIESSGAAKPSMAADPGGQLAGEWLHDAAQLAELERRELQHVAVGQRRTDVDVGVVDPAAGHPRRDLGGKASPELFEHRRELVASQHQLELGQFALATQLLHRRAEHPRQVDGAHDLVEVVALAVLGVLVETGKCIDGLLGEDRDLRLVALLHRIEQSTRQLTRRGDGRRFVCSLLAGLESAAGGESCERGAEGAVEFPRRVGILDERRPKTGLH